MLLSDQELLNLIQDPRSPLVIPPPKWADWYDGESPVQPSSIDLHIGEIYRPGEPGNAAGEAVPHDEWLLETGQTAVIRTEEVLCLPSDHAGIGFPPSRVSVRGVLMTNPGHLDPGYEGPLHLTVINMAKEGVQLRKGDMILTIVLFKLAKAPIADFKSRYGGKSPSKMSLSHLNRLSPDFARFEERAQKIADAAVERAELAIKQAQWRVGIISGFITLLVAALTVWSGSYSKYEALSEQIKGVERKLEDQIGTNKKLGELEKRINDLAPKK